MDDSSFGLPTKGGRQSKGMKGGEIAITQLLTVCSVHMWNRWLTSPTPPVYNERSVGVSVSVRHQKNKASVGGKGASAEPSGLIPDRYYLTVKL